VGSRRLNRGEDRWGGLKVREKGAQGTQQRAPRKKRKPRNSGAIKKKGVRAGNGKPGNERSLNGTQEGGALDTGKRRKVSEFPGGKKNRKIGVGRRRPERGERNGETETQKMSLPERRSRKKKVWGKN